MDTPRGSLVPRDVESAKEMQLRVTPSEMKFQDTLAGRVYRLPVTIHNLGRTNQKIRFLEPAKPQVTNPGVLGTGTREGWGSETASRPGTCFVLENRCPVPMGVGTSFLRSGYLGVSVYTCVRLFVLFYFLFCIFFLGLGQRMGKFDLVPPSFFILGLERKWFHVCFFLTAQNLCFMIL